jgi:hypothetical protein
MAKKMTIADKFDEVVNFITGEGQVSLTQDEIVDFLYDRKAKAAAKAGSKKATDRQVENESLKGVILDALTGADDGLTVTEILSTDAVASFETDAPLTNQRVTAVLRLMITNDGTVRKTKVGKVMRYFVA